MQTDRNEELRKAAAAASLEKRKQQMRRQKRRRRKRLRAFILLGLILVLIMIAVIACSVHARNSRDEKPQDAAAPAEQTEENDADAEAATASENIVIGLKGSSVQKVLVGDPYIENGAFAIDRRSGAIPEGDIVIKGKVDTSKPGEYKVTYKAKNDGDSAAAERTVQVLSEEDFGDKASNVPVMMYHWVYTADDVPEDLDGNWILDTTLEEHLAFLQENDFYYPGWKELRAWVDDEISLPVEFTASNFDDT